MVIVMLTTLISRRLFLHISEWNYLFTMVILQSQINQNDIFCFIHLCWVNIFIEYLKTACLTFPFSLYFVIYLRISKYNSIFYWFYFYSRESCTFIHFKIVCLLLCWLTVTPNLKSKISITKYIFKKGGTTTKMTSKTLNVVNFLNSQHDYSQKMLTDNHRIKLEHKQIYCIYLCC